MSQIQRLQESTTSLLNSSQHVNDSVSLVKELLDNSLDAEAKTIEVEVAPNAIDIIQVRDTGHGIRPADVHLVARRACTSKITCYDDLANLGGRYLGFRGMALASVARMSGSIEILTRAETESVGLHLQFNQKGDVVSRSPKACNPGTTVTIRNFLAYVPVRQKAVRNDCAKQLLNIKSKVQTYALARPDVRFICSERESQSSTLENAVRDVFGNALVSQCITKYWSSAAGFVNTEEPDLHMASQKHYAVSSFMPNFDSGSREATDCGQFISIDFRPVSSTKGVIKEIVSSYKNYCQRYVQHPVKNPFLCMNIMCPAGSYDPNIEPAKDAVLFSNEQEFVEVIERFFQAVYEKTANSIHSIGNLPVYGYVQSHGQVNELHIPFRDGSQVSNTTADSSQLSLPIIFKVDSRPQARSLPELTWIENLEAPDIMQSGRRSEVVYNSETQQATGGRNTQRANSGFETQDLTDDDNFDEENDEDAMRPKDPWDAIEKAALSRKLPKGMLQISRTDPVLAAPSGAEGRQPTGLPLKSGPVAVSIIRSYPGARPQAHQKASKGPMDAYLHPRVKPNSASANTKSSEIPNPSAGLSLAEIPFAPTHKRKQTNGCASNPNDTTYTTPSKKPRLDPQTLNNQNNDLGNSAAGPSISRPRVSFAPKFSSSPMIPPSPVGHASVNNGLTTPETSPLKRQYHITPPTKPFEPTKLSATPIQPQSIYVSQAEYPNRPQPQTPESAHKRTTPSRIPRMQTANTTIEAAACTMIQIGLSYENLARTDTYTRGTINSNAKSTRTASGTGSAFDLADLQGNQAEIRALMARYTCILERLLRNKSILGYGSGSGSGYGRASGSGN